MRELDPPQHLSGDPAGVVEVGNCVVVEVEDDGVFKERLPVPELEDTSGRGIHLMTAFVDEIAIREGTPRSPGTTVRLVMCKRR